LSASSFDIFNAGTHWIGGWVSTRYGTEVAKKNSCSSQDSNAFHPACRQLGHSLLGCGHILTWCHNLKTATWCHNP